MTLHTISSNELLHLSRQERESLIAYFRFMGVEIEPYVANSIRCSKRTSYYYKKTESHSKVWIGSKYIDLLDSIPSCELKRMGKLVDCK